MLIDWFTVIAQIINFLVLMWLLKRFLYKPVLNAIDAREKRIADQLALAKNTQALAAKQKTEFEEKNRQFDQQHTALLEQATAEAQTTKTKLLQQARAEVMNLRNQWQDALQKEQLALRQGIATRIQQQVLDISRKLMLQLADSELEARMVDKFLKQIDNLEDADKAQLCVSPENADCRILIRSAFALQANQQEALTSKLKTLLSLNKIITFEVEPSLLSGIELISNGHKIAWNVDDYLSSLEQSLSKLLKNHHARVETKTDD